MSHKNYELPDYNDFMAKSANTISFDGLNASESLQQCEIISIKNFLLISVSHFLKDMTWQQQATIFFTIRMIKLKYSEAVIELAIEQAFAQLESDIIKFEAYELMLFFIDIKEKILKLLQPELG